MQLFQFWRQLPQFGDSYHCWIHKLRWLFTEFPHLVESFTLTYPNNNQIPQHTRWRSLETSTVVSQLGRPPQLPSGLSSPRNRGCSCMLWGLYHNISSIYCLPFGGRNLSQGPPPPFCPHVGRNVGVGQSGQPGFWQISRKHEVSFWRGVSFHNVNVIFVIETPLDTVFRLQTIRKKAVLKTRWTLWTWVDEMFLKTIEVQLLLEKWIFSNFWESTVVHDSYYCRWFSLYPKIINQDKIVLPFFQFWTFERGSSNGISSEKKSRHHSFYTTRSCAALWAADLDWIVGPGYSFGGYILEKNHEKPT